MHNNEDAILVKNLTKIYPKEDSSWSNLMKILTKRRSLNPRGFKALDQVSFSIKRGERVAILGRNGAGKSTLLKHLMGNYKSTSGTIKINGFLYGLMNIGGGFHGLHTGYENVKSYLENLGLRDEALDHAIADTLDFAELDDFIHQPFQSYSLGMQMRLQFGAATAIKPDILVVDEILGAGDAYFQRKSAERVHNLTNRGTTLLLVSHNMSQVLEFCERAIWLEKGKIVDDAPAFELVNRYEAFLMNGFNDTSSLLDDGRSVYRWEGLMGIRLKEAKVNSHTISLGESLKIDLILKINEDDNYCCEYLLTFWNRKGVNISRIRFPLDNFKARKGDERTLTVELEPVLFHDQDIWMSFSIYNKNPLRESMNSQSNFFDIITRFLDIKISPHDSKYIFKHPVK